MKCLLFKPSALMDYQIQKRGLRGPHYTTQGAEARREVEHPSSEVIPFVLKVSRITYLNGMDENHGERKRITMLILLMMTGRFSKENETSTGEAQGCAKV